MGKPERYAYTAIELPGKKKLTCLCQDGKVFTDIKEDGKVVSTNIDELVKHLGKSSCARVGYDPNTHRNRFFALMLEGQASNGHHQGLFAEALRFCPGVDCLIGILSSIEHVPIDEVKTITSRLEWGQTDGRGELIDYGYSTDTLMVKDILSRLTGIAAQDFLPSDESKDQFWTVGDLIGGHGIPNEYDPLHENDILQESVPQQGSLVGQNTSDVPDALEQSGSDNQKGHLAEACDFSGFDFGFELDHKNDLQVDVEQTQFHDGSAIAATEPFAAAPVPLEDLSLLSPMESQSSLQASSTEKPKKKRPVSHMSQIHPDSSDRSMNGPAGVSTTDSQTFAHVMPETEAGWWDNFDEFTHNTYWTHDVPLNR